MYNLYELQSTEQSRIKLYALSPYVNIADVLADKTGICVLTTSQPALPFTKSVTATLTVSPFPIFPNVLVRAGRVSI